MAIINLKIIINIFLQTHFFTNLAFLKKFAHPVRIIITDLLNLIPY